MKHYLKSNTKRTSHYFQNDHQPWRKSTKSTTYIHILKKREIIDTWCAKNDCAGNH